MHDEHHRALQIRTPEGVTFAVPLAGPASRFLAWGIDAFVTAVASIAIMMGVQSLALFAGEVAIALGIILTFAAGIGYGIAFEWFFRGQTVGKSVLGIRVMDVQGLQLRFSQIALRNFLRLVDALPMFYFVGGAALILSPRFQRLGDIAANTVVVRTRPAEQPDLDQIRPDKYNSFRDYPHLEGRLRQQIDPQEASLLVHALLRRAELEPQARVALYRDLADDLRTRVTFPEEATLGLSDEQYLRNAVESLYRRRKAA